MSTSQPLAPVCQSCAMPLRKPDDFGTEANGARSEEYCTHCYQGGSFTDPNMTMERMTQIVADIMKAEMDFPEATARGAAQASLVGLHRWQEDWPSALGGQPSAGRATHRMPGRGVRRRHAP